MPIRVRACCCCFPLKTGIVILGILETFLFILICLAVIAATVYYGMYQNYNIVPYYVTPFVAYMPNVVAFYILVCKKFTLSSRKCYYLTRVFCLVMLIICALLQVGLAWYFICANYSIKHCNVRKPYDSEIYYIKYLA